jgi:hypothetical protein
VLRLKCGTEPKLLLDHCLDGSRSRYGARRIEAAVDQLYFLVFALKVGFARFHGPGFVVAPEIEHLATGSVSKRVIVIKTAAAGPTQPPPLRQLVGGQSECPFLLLHIREIRH